MMKRCALGCWLLFFQLAALAAPVTTVPSIGEFSAKFEMRAGFLNLHLDPAEGKTYLEVPNDLGELIYQQSLARGIGSNDIGIDRGQLGGTQLVEFVRVGSKVLLQAKNTRYRAVSSNPQEQQAVEEAFATSVLWGFKVVATSDDAYLIDYTDFLLSDAYGLGTVLKQRKQGEFKVNADRSAMYFAMTKSFPNNTELEAIITMTGKDAGRELKSVSPDTGAVTVHVHHSLVALPKPGYKMRAYHPESGFFAMAYADYAVPLQADLIQRFIHRHRLEKLNPGAAKSPAVEPIIYYLDPGVPEPVRSALFEGANWWDEAFEAAGFIDAFQVKYLPEGADPMDARYNVIQWVHRRTRGWSYGASVRDPRTGEIIKGKVTLGSLRVRQDLLIAQGLLSPFKDGAGDVANDKLQAMALARIRQLSAHEIGHTLGLVHNFSASTYDEPNDRGSVMDYPHPMLRMKDDRVDLSSAYAVGIGTWDKHAVTYGYAEVTMEEESDFLLGQIQRARAQGMRLMTDADARAAGGGHPRAHLWDSDQDILTGLENTFRVRASALSHLGESSLSEGRPYSDLEKILVPIFYLHRYQTEAVVKLVGGANYHYELKGEGQNRLEAVDPKTQEKALELVLQTLNAGFLTTPDTLLAMILPNPAGFARGRENAPSNLSPYFDPVTTAEAAAEETLRFLLNPQRLARISQQAAANPRQFSAAGVIDRLITMTIAVKPKDGLLGEVQKRVDFLVLEHLLEIVWGEQQVPEVRAAASAALVGLAEDLEDSRSDFDQYMARLIDRADEAGAFERRTTVAKIPPGSPI